MTDESARLRYPRITREHAVALRAALCDPRLYTFIGDGTPPTPDELLASFGRKESGPPPQRSAETWIDHAVVLKDSDEALGRVEATLLEARAEIAYIFGWQHWGHGYAREAVRWLEERLARTHAVHALWATVQPANRRSIALLESLGYAEAPRDCWPDPLLTRQDGDRVFCRVTTGAGSSVADPAKR
jgi:RimJ/RimL family protein N-acetyltransferase